MCAMEFTANQFPNNICEYIDTRLTDSCHGDNSPNTKLSDTTISRYNQKWQSFIASAQKRENSFELDIILPSIITNFEESVNSKEWRHATYRQYKAVICFGLATTLLNVREDYLELPRNFTFDDLENLYKKVISTNLSYDKKSEQERLKRTSALKRKEFPKKFYDWLNQYEHSHEKRIAVKNIPTNFTLVISFIRANLLIGLRPKEWLNLTITCNLHEQCIELIVKNAKASQERANGLYRNLLLNDISQEDELSILQYYILLHRKLYSLAKKIDRKQIEFEGTSQFQGVKNNSFLLPLIDDFTPSTHNPNFCKSLYVKNGVPQEALINFLMKNMQDTLYKLYQEYCDYLSNLGLPPDIEIDNHQNGTITLYSTRHQCVANAKKSKIPKEEIAAFFGHASTDTATKHYGRAWHSWSSFKFRPSPDSIKRVRNLNKAYRIDESKIALDKPKNSLNYSMEF